MAFSESWRAVPGIHSTKFLASWFFGVPYLQYVQFENCLHFEHQGHERPLKNSLWLRAKFDQHFESSSPRDDLRNRDANVVA